MEIPRYYLVNLHCALVGDHLRQVPLRAPQRADGPPRRKVQLYGVVVYTKVSKQIISVTSF